MPRRQILSILALVALTVIALAAVWEFAAEDYVWDLLWPGHQAESAVEHWEYVATAGCFVLLALIVPAWMLCRIAAHHERAESEVREINASLERRVADRTMELEHELGERHRIERSLQQSEERFRDFAETAAHWVWETDRELNFTFLGGRVHDVLGRRSGEIVGTSYHDLITTGSVDGASLGEHRARVDSHQAFDDFRCSWRRADGDVRVIQLSGKPIFDGDGVFVGYRGNGNDVTEMHALSQELSHQARHDMLTGLANRREFELHLGSVIESAGNGGVEHALCYIDLDQFKIVNDTCGHAAGDELLRQVSALMQRCVRKGDLLARLGGDEFGLLMTQCTLEQANRAIDGLRAAIAEFRFLWQSKAFRIAASIGMVPVHHAEGTVASVLAAADTACLAAKQAGRNRIHIGSDDAQATAVHRPEAGWVARLRQAIDEDRLLLYQQAIVALDPGRDEGLRYEVLVRLEDDGGDIAAGAFMPTAERHDLANRIDRWMIRAALDWLDAHPGHVARLEHCAINISGQSLGAGDFLEFVNSELDRHHVASGKICFEITETAAIANLAHARRFIGELKGRGCHFALDDFGSGMSSFGYLKNLPVDFLKVDGSFIRDIDSDAVDLAIVRSIHGLAHAVGAKTIAECVETEATRACLGEIGIDFAQGSAIGRPARIERLLEPCRPLRPVLKDVSS